MFGIGFTELVLILIVALIVLGPERLVELSKEVGRLMVELRRALQRVQSTIEEGSDNPHKHP